MNEMNLKDKITLPPIRKISGDVNLPGSKSVSNRILLLSMLAKGETEIQNLLDSDDIRYMVEGMKKLGVKFNEDRYNKLI